MDFYSTNSLSWEQLEYGTEEILNLHYGLIHVGLPTMVDLSKDKLPNIKYGNNPKNYELCKEGDIAFADASEDTNEVAKTIEFCNLDGKDVICGLHTIHGRDNKDITGVGFKGYAFSSTAFHNQIRCIAQGTKIYSISTKNFSECYIGIPSKDEQAKIASLLGLIDERIATQNKIIDRLESLIRGINQYAFTSKGVNYKLEELCEIRSGYSGNQLTSKNGLKVSRIETISGHKVNMERVGYVAPFESSGNYRLQIGDILFSNINSVEYIGNTAFIDKDYNLYHGMNLLRLTPNKKVVMPFYLYLLLNTNRMLNHFKTVCNKAVSQASINQTELGKTVIRIPDLKAQKQICELFQALYAKLESESYAISLLQNQKQHLLRQMFI
ncbi:hypothetical protein IX307_002784 [Bacteroides pyogenes]|uniref:Hypothetical YciO protein n=1 Tax=Bacteroides pyogenes DSM 20611 = JCM 6294 TaxID=1121100 RepID=W4PGM9_9BACE|nr:restriction endonuclease subunit S [Bacteroides pyogenes]MBR8788431.1 hypothetical protein [Bacteroides pyogenes]GAE18860.1 hypothetical YciO protein [Bacteroides pyogenes DSM 20611 = JCM 6294]